MYLGHSTRHRINPAGLGAALAINAAVIVALLNANPDVVGRFVAPPPLKIFTPEPPQPKPELLPRPVPHPLPNDAVASPPDHPIDPLPLPPLSGNDVETDSGDTSAGSDPSGTGASGTEPVAILPFVAASIDPRYARDFEPAYPDALRDAGMEGVIIIKVLVSPSGRVTRAEPLSGPAPLLTIATRHALAHWRFRPATRGGVPEESWKTMTVRFRLDS